MVFLIADLPLEEAKNILLNDFQGKIVDTDGDCGYDILIPYSLVTDDPNFEDGLNCIYVGFEPSGLRRTVDVIEILLDCDWHFEAWTELFWDYFEKNTDYNLEMEKDYDYGSVVYRRRGEIPRIKSGSKKTA